MINPTVEKAFNEQINKELYSSYLYLAMAAYFDANNFLGMSSWMKKQAQEEIEHAMKFYSYIYDKGGKVQLDLIEKPQNPWQSPLEAFTAAYEHECKVSSSIHALCELSAKEKDIASSVFLQWFVTEQVEEESSTLTIVEKLKMTKDNKAALLFIDKELSTRV